jgi:polyisoprenoid-binding protein YceI
MSSRLIRTRLGVLALTLAASAVSPGPTLYDVTAPSTLRFHLTHKFHQVDGTTTQVEGKVRLLPGGAVQLMARAPVASFDSGNGNRDAHMLEVLEAKRYPEVSLKAVGQGLTVPTTFPSQQMLPAQAELTFHGINQPLSFSVRVRWTAPGKGTADATFPVSLAAFHIERPSLAFIPVDDSVTITAHLSFSEEHR